MMRTLWERGAGPTPDVASYTVGDDRAWDARLLEWDILGSLGHVAGLEASGLLTAGEGRRLVTGLRRLLADARAGSLAVTAEDEDVHTAVERALTGRLGAVAEKLHTGRSRNDQIATDLRLYLKDRLLALSGGVLDVSTALTAFAGAHSRTVFPGYTHQRRAMPSTMGLWAAGYAEALLDDLTPLAAASALADRSPLGSGAGFGVPLPLNREAAAAALGFAGVQRGVTAVASTRGKLEAIVLAAAWAIGYDLAKLAWDVILYSSEEYGFILIPGELATGSSIMPNKRNPDVFELTRARAAVLEACLHEVMAVAGTLPGGYHRDLQLTKGPLMRGLDIAGEMLAMMKVAVPRLRVDAVRCAAACTPEIYATDEVLQRARRGTPFRAAYREVADELARGIAPPGLPPASVLVSRKATGNAGNLGLGAVRSEIRRWRSRLARARSSFWLAMDNLGVGR